MMKKRLIPLCLLLLLVSLFCLFSCGKEKISTDPIAFQINYKAHPSIDLLEREDYYYAYYGSVVETGWFETTIDKIISKERLPKAPPEERVPAGYHFAGYYMDAYHSDFEIDYPFLFDENMNPVDQHMLLWAKEDEYALYKSGSYFFPKYEEHYYIELYPAYKPNTYTFAFDAGIGRFENGESTQAYEVVYRSQIEDMPTPSVYGYTFDGWYNAEGVRVSEGALPVMRYFIDFLEEDVWYDISEETIPFTARYIPNEYTVTVDLGLPDVEKTVYTIPYGEPMPDLSVHYVDLGGRDVREWSISDAGVATPPETVSGDMTIYPVWDDYKNVAFAFPDGTEETLKLYRDGEKIHDFPVIGEIPGYRFVSWLDGEGNPIEGAAFNDLEETYYGDWLELDYAVNLIVPDGMAVEPMRHTYGQVTQLPLLALDGYSFLGWYIDNPDECVYVLPADLWEDVTLTARFAPRVFSVNLVADGVNLTERFATATYGESFTITPPEREGYRFLGWFDAPEGGVPMTDADGNSLAPWTSLNETLTFYAVWEEATAAVRE